MSEFAVVLISVAVITAIVVAAFFLQRLFDLSKFQKTRHRPQIVVYRAKGKDKKQ